MFKGSLVMLNVNFTSVVPAPLLDTPNWVVWRYETRHGKQTKVPYQAVPVDGDPKAKSNDSSTWADFCDAFAECYNGPEYNGPAYDGAPSRPRYDGVGFMLVGSKYTRIDFDGVAPNRVIDPYVANILKLAGNPYAECSPSGVGVRMFVGGTQLPLGKRKFSTSGTTKFGAEIYSGAETGRYLTVTGDKIKGSGNSIPALTEWELELVYLLVSQILEDKFKALWLNDQDFIAKNYAEDQSRADAALCAMLVPLFGRDPEKIEAAFSESGLGEREKWINRKDYRDRTITNAINLPPLTNGLIMPDQSTPKKKNADVPEEVITRKMSMTRADQIQPEITPWLWPSRIVANNINVFSGEPDMGKGLTCVDFVSRLTTQRDFPDSADGLLGATC